MNANWVKRGAVGIIAALCAVIFCTGCATTHGTLNVDVGHPGARIGPLFYGLMTEEINHSYDGGLYGELIQNRIFQDDPDQAVHWSIVQTGGAAGGIAIDETEPVNNGALRRSLRLDVKSAGPGGRVGIANDGYWGIPVWGNTTYRASFYARASEGFVGPLTVDIESADGAMIFASGSAPQVSLNWKKYELELKTPALSLPRSTRGGEQRGNRLVISVGGEGRKGSVWFSLVSLFGPTYHGRANGNRVDLMEKLAALQPGFLRFPGGNYLEGDTVAERFEWKKTIGPLEDRPGHRSCWGYRSSDGLGLLEFLDWCEDLHMEPLLAVYAGYSLKGEHIAAGRALEPFVREALEEIEYCTGDAKTVWGKRRAADGHPEPFVIHYVEIGNEDNFDRSGSYDARFTQFFDAIKAKYPQLQCIATTGVHSRRPDLYDDHAYPSARGMLRRVHRYDDRDPNLPRVFFGEWASQNGKPTPTMRAALSDAAWLTGMQNDAGTVIMNCYAPLLVNVNEGASQWPTNLIGYDAGSSFGSPSYYAQAMFRRNQGDVVLPVKLVAPALSLPPSSLPKGGVGVGTWRTSAQFADLKVTHDDQTFFQSDFTNDLKHWTQFGGNWRLEEGLLAQPAMTRTALITTGEANWRDYTVTVKARKTAGREGFLLLFHVRDRDNYLWFNVGGWNNSRCAVEETTDGDKNEIGTSTPFTVERGRWYDLRVEVHGSAVQCYVDGKLMGAVSGILGQMAGESVFASASRVDSTGEIIVKVVNVSEMAQKLEIALDGAGDVASNAMIETLVGKPEDQNSVDFPERVSPKKNSIDNAGRKFMYEFPGDSVTVIRLNVH